MITIEAKIEENKDLRDRVKCLLGYQSSCRRLAGQSLGQKEDPRVRLISSRKATEQSAKNKYRKVPALFLGPAENPHVSKYKLALQQFPMSCKKQPWSDVEKDKLARGVKQQYQEALILDSLNNGSAIGDFSAVDMAYAMTNGAGNFEVTPESLRSVLPLINWDKISAMYLPGRSGAECESRWLNCDDPLINHQAWTAEEEKRLILIIQEKGMCNWINIAVTLGTHRTPFQCLVRYQRSLNPHILKKAWTKEEDLQLRAAVETFGEKWQLVSASLDGRIGSQCSNRWRKTLHPTRTRVGRWLLDEDKRLMISVKLMGSGSWSRIAQFIPGRTQTQISERWSNILDPNIDLGPWRPEEDAKLLAAVSELGPCWSKIAMVIIPGRNDSMCSRRWNKLCENKVSSAKAARQIKKSIFQTNFVDREKERPAIAPSDLLLLVQPKGDGFDENTRGRPKNQASENLAASSIVNHSAGSDSVAANTVSNINSRRSRRKSSGGTYKKRTEANVAVPDGMNDSSGGPSRSRRRKSTNGNHKAVQRRTRRSVPVDNEAVPMELNGTISTDSVVGINRMRDPASVGEEASVKKRTRRSKSVGTDGAARKMRGSISADNDSGTDGVGDPVCGEEGVVKKITRSSKPAGNEGTVRKRMRGSISVGDEGVVKRRRTASLSAENHGVTKRKRAPPRRKSAEDNLTPEGIANAAPELDLSSAPSEERVVEAGNVDKGRRKSTPRPKQINISEEAADEHSTFTRLANCMSFARMNGVNRNKR